MFVLTIYFFEFKDLEEDRSKVVINPRNSLAF
jgi:hypothetical protein